MNRDKKIARIPKTSPGAAPAGETLDVIKGTYDQSIDSSTAPPYTGTVVESTNADLVGQEVPLDNYTRRFGPSGTQFVAVAFRVGQNVTYLIVDAECKEVAGDGGPGGVA